MEKTLSIKINSKGEISCETNGFSGRKCTDAVKFLEKIGEKTRDEKKPDFYKEPPTDPLITVDNKK